jgi:hypothetical protein
MYVCITIILLVRVAIHVPDPIQYGPNIFDYQDPFLWWNPDFASSVLSYDYRVSLEFKVEGDMK